MIAALRRLCTWFAGVRAMEETQDDFWARAW
jgi:hypothetical protein